MIKRYVVPAVLVVTELGLVSACMTMEDQEAIQKALDIHADRVVPEAASSDPSSGSSPGSSSGSSPSIASAAVAPACFQEQFVQPEAQISRSIDILFVMDTSGSMLDNRVRVANGISSFVSELPPEVDYRVAVLLSQGGKGAWSGKLFTYGGSTVFDSKKMTVDKIRLQLKKMVIEAPRDRSSEQSEESMFSLMKALTTNLEYNRSKGFFREDAALSVVFVSDENDICAPYVDNPAMPGLTSYEKTLRGRDCSNGISTDAVIAQVKSVQGARPYMFGAVVHKELNYKDKDRNDGFGWGYMEIIHATNGVSTEINDGSYKEGLSNMGKMATSKLQLVLDYSLSHGNVDPATIQASVDGSNVNFIFDAALNDIHLSEGGGSKSVVTIEYCEKPAEVSPDSGSGSDTSGSSGSGSGSDVGSGSGTSSGSGSDVGSGSGTSSGSGSDVGSGSGTSSGSGSDVGSGSGTSSGSGSDVGSGSGTSSGSGSDVGSGSGTSSGSGSDVGSGSGTSSGSGSDVGSGSGTIDVQSCGGFCNPLGI